MIPQKIHYCWLGNGKKSPFIKDCINSWSKVMPNYEIKCWNENSFDLDSLPWVKEAMLKKKYSLASDYIRHYALYTEGGIYMDTDVKVYKPFDEFLNLDFFSSVEYHPEIFTSRGSKQLDTNGIAIVSGDYISGLGILAALIAAKPQNPFIKECMDFFSTKHFINPDGTLYTDIINPAIMANIATKYGFVYQDKTQYLDNNMVVFNSSVFAGNNTSRTPHSYSMHFCDGSWRDKTILQSVKSWIKDYLIHDFRK